MQSIRRVINVGGNVIGVTPHAVPNNQIALSDMPFAVAVIFESMGFRNHCEYNRGRDPWEVALETRSALTNLFHGGLGKVLAWISRFLGVRLRMVGTMGQPSYMDGRVKEVYIRLKYTLCMTAEASSIVCATPHNHKFQAAIVMADYLLIAQDFVDGETGWGYKGLTVQEWLESGGEEWMLSPHLKDIPMNVCKGLKDTWPGCV